MERKQGTRRRRWSRPLLYTIVLVLVTGAGATAVFLRGSAQRRDDRAAIVAYERDVLRAVRDGGRVVQQEMKPSLREFVEGELTGKELMLRAAAWRRVFAAARSDVLALDAPGFLGDIDARWAAAMDGYLAAVEAFEALARGPADQRDSLVSDAAAAGERGDDLFDRAAAVIQFHRRLLGLGPSPDLPDPDAGTPKDG